ASGRRPTGGAVARVRRLAGSGGAGAGCSNARTRAARAGGGVSWPSVADLDAVLEESVNSARTMAPAAPVEAVLAGLAAVPAGVSEPLTLFALAVGELEEPGRNLAAIRDALVALGEMVARADPGTSDESVGPVHDLIGNFLAARLSREQLAQAHLR